MNLPIPPFAGDNVIKVAYGVWGAKSGRNHSGADPSTKSDPTIRTAGNGFVAFAGTDPTSPTDQWGVHVRIYLNQTDAVRRVGTIREVSAHNTRNLVTTGQRVVAGQGVGIMGNSGNAAKDPQGPHVHRQYDRWNGSAWINIDPTPYIGGTNTAGLVWFGTAQGEDNMRSLDTPGANQIMPNGRPRNIQGFETPNVNDSNFVDNIPNDRYLIVEGERAMAGSTLQGVRIWNHRLGRLLWVALLGTGITEVHDITPEQARDRNPAWLANAPHNQMTCPPAGVPQADYDAAIARAKEAERLHVEAAGRVVELEKMLANGKRCTIIFD